MELHITEKRLIEFLTGDPQWPVETICAANNVRLTEKQFSKYRKKVLKRKIVFDSTALLFSRHEQWMELSDLTLFKGKWFLFPDIFQRYPLVEINKLLVDNEYWTDKRFVMRSIPPEEFINISDMHELLAGAPALASELSNLYAGFLVHYDYPEEHIEPLYTSLNAGKEDNVTRVLDQFGVTAHSIDRITNDRGVYIAGYIRGKSVTTGLISYIPDYKTETDEAFAEYIVGRLERSIGATIWASFPIVTESIIAAVWKKCMDTVCEKVTSKDDRRSIPKIQELLAIARKNPPTKEALLFCLLNTESTSVHTVVLEALNLFETDGIDLSIDKRRLYEYGPDKSYTELLDIVDSIFNRIPKDYIKKLFGGNNGKEGIYSKDN